VIPTVCKNTILFPLAALVRNIQQVVSQDFDKPPKNGPPYTHFSGTFLGGHHLTSVIGNRFSLSKKYKVLLIFFIILTKLCISINNMYILQKRVDNWTVWVGLGLITLYQAASDPDCPIITPRILHYPFGYINLDIYFHSK